MNNGRVVTTTNKLSDARCRHLGVLLCEVHRYLAYHDVVALATLAEHLLLRHVIVIANLFQNVIYSKWLVVYLDSTLDHTLSQSHIHIRIIDNGIGQKRIDNSLQVADTAIGCLSNKLNNISGNFQTITTALSIEDINT